MDIYNFCNDINRLNKVIEKFFEINLKNINERDFEFLIDYIFREN